MLPQEKETADDENKITKFSAEGIKVKDSH
jgi:hypothetical protein